MAKSVASDNRTSSVQSGYRSANQLTYHSRVELSGLRSSAIVLLLGELHSSFGGLLVHYISILAEKGS